MTDTIYALATAPGRAAVAVVRLSGPRSGDALERLTGGARPEPRRASLRRLRDPQGRHIDDALLLWFPAPASYTGEDSAEVHLHGGPAVVDALTDALSAQGLRAAEPGEFTRRAFENGKLDLAQAEAVADLVNAESEAQRRQALAQLEGALGRRYEHWRATLIEALAWLEAEIDFPDEDVPGGLAARVRPALAELLAALDEALADAGRGEQVRNGWRIAVIGAPNAGKSSVFNALVRREAAIVMPIAGTTRDIIEANLELEGYRVILADMAGLRETSDPVEAEGVRRARAWAAGAAIRLWVVDASASKGAWREGVDLLAAEDVLVLNKADLAAGSDAEAATTYGRGLGCRVLPLSTVGGTGLEALDADLRTRISAALSGGEFPAATRARHRQRLEEARGHLARGLEALDQGAELAAEDLRLGARALGRITGRIDPEDVLDVVFASFCIGK